MSPTPSSDRAAHLLAAALDHDPAERNAFLVTACGEDSALLVEVRAMLAAHEAMPSGFLKEPAVKDFGASVLEATIKHEPGMIPSQREAVERAGERIGRYKLLQKIGEGGFGTVWMAEQMEPVTRRVALKIIKMGMDTREVIARFEQERQALAMMDHPNIAKVLDAGATDKGRPFFVMELVKGLPITTYCDEAQLSTRERLALFGDVCSAIQHAHQKGVIHRDIKPSNVMVTVHGDKPVVKVIDFGIAKATQGPLTDKTLFTRFDQFVGTPVYMSPEQATLSGLDIDTRSDIYALGILLYELLTGKPPFDAKSLISAGYEEMRRIIREVEPPKPSSRLSAATAEERTTIARARRIDPEKLDRVVESDLDWIVMKALEKDRTRRYETADSLAQDIVRFLNDEPVSATPPSASYRFRKWVRRNKAAFAAGSAIAASLVIGLSVSMRLFFQEKAAHKEAVAERENAHRQLYIADMLLAKQAWDEANVPRVLELLSRHRPELGAPDLRNFEWYYLERLCRSDLLTLKGHTHRVWSVVFSPDGKRLASASSDMTVRLWDVTSGRETLTLKMPQSDKRSDGAGLWRVAFRPDGRQLAAVGSSLYNGSTTIKIWDAMSGQEMLTLDGERARSKSIAYSPDGKLLATGSDQPGKVKLWDTTNGQAALALKDYPGACVAFSPDGKQLAAGSIEDPVHNHGSNTPGDVTVWDTMTGEVVLKLKGHAGEVMCVKFSPDGKRLATGSFDKTVKLWDVTSGHIVLSLTGHRDAVWSVAFSPDGKRLASAGGDRTVKVWDITRGQETLTLRGHTAEVHCVDFSPDGKRLASASSDGTVKIWDASSIQEGNDGKSSADLWREYDEAKAAPDAGKPNLEAKPPLTKGASEAYATMTMEDEPHTSSRVPNEDKARFNKLSDGAKEKFRTVMAAKREQMSTASPEQWMSFIKNLLAKLEAEDRARKLPSP